MKPQGGGETAGRLLQTECQPLKLQKCQPGICLLQRSGALSGCVLLRGKIGQDNMPAMIGDFLMMRHGKKSFSRNVLTENPMMNRIMTCGLWPDTKEKQHAFINKERRTL